MNILLIGPPENNATDGVIIKGIKNLLSMTYAGYIYTYLELNDFIIMSDEQLLDKNKFDMVVVCGTPWLWDSFQKSVKYKNLLRTFQLHKNSKKLCLGLGSCLTLEDINSNILERPEEVEGIKALFSEATLITRDIIAWNKLTKAGLVAHNLPCPAYYSYGINPTISNKSETNVLIWIDPTKSISAVSWKDTNKLKDFCNIALDFYKRHNADVYCALDSDIELALSIGLPRPKVLKRSEDTLELMKNANYVLSGRVHCAVPAYIQGKALGIMPIDSRSHVLTDHGATSVTTVKDLDKLQHKSFDFADSLDHYRKLL